MAWTEEDEKEFQRKKAEHFAELAKEEEAHRVRVEMGLEPRCPSCGSHKYSEGIWFEQCGGCGHSQSY